MSTIDEIIGAIGRHGDDCIRDADAASESFEALREMIASALADAERKGAAAMRWECECFVRPYMPRELDGDHHAQHDIADAIRALPLPTGKRQAELAEAAEWECKSGGLKPLSQRLYDKQPDKIKQHYTRIKQAVLLTDAEVKQIGDATLYAGGIYDRVRAIEAAVLAANSLEVRRG